MALTKPNTEWTNGYYSSDVDGDLSLDISGLSAFGSRAAATEAVSDYNSSWIWANVYDVDDFELSTDQYRFFSYTQFGGHGNNNPSSQISNVDLELTNPDWFSHNWNNEITDTLDGVSATWVKHTIEYVTDVNGNVTYSHVITDGEGTELSNTARTLFVDVADSSWAVLQNTTNPVQGGFSIDFRIVNQGDVAMDNLKVSDISDRENPVIILENNFDDGDKGLFSSQASSQGN